MLRDISPNMVKIQYNTLFSECKKHDNLYPDMSHTKAALGVKETWTTEQSISKTLDWFLSK